MRLLPALLPGVLGLGYNLALFAGLLPSKLPVPANRLMDVLGNVAVVAILGLWIARFFGFLGGPIPAATWWS